MSRFEEDEVTSFFILNNMELLMLLVGGAVFVGVLRVLKVVVFRRSALV
jgi:hypothetical protein